MWSSFAANCHWWVVRGSQIGSRLGSLGGMFTCLEKWQAQSYCSRSWIPLQCQAVEIIICSHQMQEKLNYLQAKVVIAALSSTTCFPRQFWVQISAGSRRHQDFRWIAMTVHIHIHTGIHSMIFIYGLIHSSSLTSHAAMDPQKQLKESSPRPPRLWAPQSWQEVLAVHWSLRTCTGPLWVHWRTQTNVVKWEMEVLTFYW